ncbi:hypothetical protein [Paraburkholderia strydomiana]|uniref:AbiU2 domain-containing protein n=1 Tax=Paraburkholderia strydomiana TaxID=1245417 RepID=UPI001BEA65CB|nr:hypothetical protein [Paraburkholderia strydomiana]MBT2791216.1 hypothetical protein [Paraburkholderia strydomiana]
MADDKHISRLVEKVKAAENEIVMAVMFHETWKPAAYDENLHERMGNSYATNSFNVVRQALRRETLLALMRLWDDDHRSVGMQAIAKDLSAPSVFGTLVAHRARMRRPTIQLGPSAGLSPTTIEDAYKDTLNERREEFCALVSKYTQGGDGHATFKKLVRLRNVNLAHRQAMPTKPNHADPDDEEIEAFYNDNLEIVRLLLSLVLGRAFDLKDVSGVYNYHAKFFWAAARGEHTEGHPDYRPPPGARE